MLYTNTDRAHISVDAVAALSLFNGGATRRELRITDVAMWPLVNGSIDVDLSFDKGAPLKLTACVEKNGMLSVATLSDNNDREVAIFTALSHFMGGSFQTNDGTYYRLGSVPSPYDAGRRLFLSNALQSAGCDALSERDRAEAESVIGLYETMPAMRAEQGDVLLPVASTHPMRTYVYSGSRQSLMSALEALPLGVKCLDGCIMLKSHFDITVLTLNDLSDLDPASRAYFQVNPATLQDITLIKTANDRFIQHWLPSARSVFEVVVERLKQRTENVHLSDMAFTVENVVRSGQGEGLVQQGKTIFFRRSRLEEEASILQENPPISTFLDGLMMQLAQQYATISSTRLPDVSGNPLFDTIRLSIDGRCADVQFASAGKDSKEFIGISVQGASNALTPEVDIIVHFLLNKGGITRKELDSLISDWCGIAVGK